MKVLVTYDSLMGNDAKLARAVARELEKESHKVHFEKVISETPERAREADLIVISSPTRAGSTTRKLRKFADALAVKDKPFLLLGTSMAFMVRRGARAGVEHLADILESKGASVRNYIRPNGKPGTAHDEFNVAHGVGKQCPNCGGPIKRIVVRNRGTYFCPRCQAAP